MFAAQHTLEQMKADWKLICQAERSSVCKCAIADMQFLMSAPVRLACNLFEISGWDGNCLDRRDVLCVCCRFFQTTRSWKMLIKQRALNPRRRPTRGWPWHVIHSTVVNSQIFESRGLSNANSSHVSKAEFIQKAGSIWGFQQEEVDAMVLQAPQAFWEHHEEENLDNSQQGAVREVASCVALDALLIAKTYERVCLPWCLE